MDVQIAVVSLWAEVEEDANSRWAMFHDPAGNLIELVQFKHAATHSS